MRNWLKLVFVLAAAFQEARTAVKGPTVIGFVCSTTLATPLCEARARHEGTRIARSSVANVAVPASAIGTAKRKPRSRTEVAIAVEAEAHLLVVDDHLLQGSQSPPRGGG